MKTINILGGFFLSVIENLIVFTMTLLPATVIFGLTTLITESVIAGIIAVVCTAKMIPVGIVLFTIMDMEPDIKKYGLGYKMLEKIIFKFKIEEEVNIDQRIARLKVFLQVLFLLLVIPIPTIIDIIILIIVGIFLVGEGL